MEYMDDYLDAKTAYLDGEYVYHNINKDYVEVETSESVQGASISGAYVNYKTHTNYYLNNSGRRYVEQQKEKVRKVAANIYRVKRID